MRIGNLKESSGRGDTRGQWGRGKNPKIIARTWNKFGNYICLIFNSKVNFRPRTSEMSLQLEETFKNKKLLRSFESSLFSISKLGYFRPPPNQKVPVQFENHFKNKKLTTFIPKYQEISIRLEKPFNLFVINPRKSKKNPYKRQKLKKTSKPIAIWKIYQKQKLNTFIPKLSKNFHITWKTFQLVRYQSKKIKKFSPQTKTPFKTKENYHFPPKKQSKLFKELLRTKKWPLHPKKFIYSFRNLLKTWSFFLKKI